MRRFQPIVEELISLLKARPDLADALIKSIVKAYRSDVKTLPQYYDFLDRMVTLIPTDRNLNPVLLKFYYLIDLSPENILQSDRAFQQWTLRFAEEWGSFLDTTRSAARLTDFFSDPKYHMGDFYVSPSGWLTFNQFFARQVRPGKRPVDSRCDDDVVVSPADSVFQGHWQIHDDSRITVKGLRWSIVDLLDGSPYQARFKGGVFTHSFLDVNDYHRYLYQW